MRSTQWHHFGHQCLKNHWETIDETGVSERWNRSETPLSEWFSKPRKAFQTAPFLVPLIFYNNRSMRKTAAKKQLFPLRDFIANISMKRSETLHRLKHFFATSVSSVSSVSIWNAIRHGVSYRVIRVVVLNITMYFIRENVLIAM